MTVLKCKMCGGDLNVTDESKVVECEFCGTTQTVLMPDNEKKTNLYNRANRLRFANEFNKSAAVFESLVAEFPEEAEAYWGLCLCKYGIEYVDDPATGKKIPTCHRTSYESIFDDPNFELAQEYADPIAKSIYREEAKSIDRIQKGILEIANKEEPFDIFICYKETDDKGERTIDSVLAQVIYDELTEKGYRVFFSRITLEDKLGQEYEPYIFSALNSSKIMLVIGTEYEYFEAVWVKNEWSRFLDLMKNDKSKTLIPCYRDIDVYDMPREFKNLQGQDMGKLGFLQDLIRGVNKLLNKDSEEKRSEGIDDNDSENKPTVNSLLGRVEIFLSDSDWESADQYCEKVLDIDPKNAQAYLFKLMADLKIRNYEELYSRRTNINDSSFYKKVYDFGNDGMKKRLQIFDMSIKYNNIIDLLNKAATIDDYKNVKSMFTELGEFKDSEEKLEFCNNKIDDLKSAQMNCFNEAVELYNSGKYKEAILKFFKCDTFGTMQETVTYLRNMLKYNASVSCGSEYTVALKTDGTVIASGLFITGPRNIGYDWRNLVAIDCGYSHILGLKADGTVIAIGNNVYDECNVNDWNNIDAIACGAYHTVGLKANGTVTAVGSNTHGECNVGHWSGITALACGKEHTIGLKTDGTVIATGNNIYDECNIDEWCDIDAIACGFSYTVGLKRDGTVTSTGRNEYGECNVSGWKDIVAVSCGKEHTVGLKADGRVIAVGNNNCGQCNIEDWEDILAIACGKEHTVGLKADGSLIAVGSNKYGECSVKDWTGIDVFTNIKRYSEYKENIKKRSIEKEAEKKKPVEESESNKEKQRMIQLTSQLEKINVEIIETKSNLNSLGFALWGKKAEEKKELQSKIDTLAEQENYLREEIEKTQKKLSSVKKNN